MHKFSRQKILLKKIQEKEFTPINDLITFVRNTYSFTAITVRRDLKEIAKEGHIKLLHGEIKYINKTQSQIKLLCTIAQTYVSFKRFLKVCLENWMGCLLLFNDSFESYKNNNIHLNIFVIH